MKVLDIREKNRPDDAILQLYDDQMLYVGPGGCSGCCVTLSLDGMRRLRAALDDLIKAHETNEQEKDNNEETETR